MTDSLTQAEPHYCTTKPLDNGGFEGCPDWPMCVFSPGGRVPSALVEPDDDPEPEFEDEIPGIGQSLAALAGYAAAAVIFLVVVAILLPLFI